MFQGGIISNLTKIFTVAVEKYKLEEGSRDCNQRYENKVSSFKITLLQEFVKEL